MSNKQKNICRICLKVVKNEFFKIQGVIRRMLEILFLTVDLNITRDPVICPNCVEAAKKCLKFKLTCFSTERTLLLCSADDDIAKRDIKVIQNETEYVQTVVEDVATCRICMARLERNNSLDTLRNNTIMFEMISEFLPEMDVNVFNYPSICTMCKGNLKCFLKFVLNCLDTEAKIKSFCKEQGNGRIDQVNLGNLLNFLCKDILECAEKSPQTCTNKEELYKLEGKECVYPEVYSRSIKLEEVDIKQEIHLGDSYKPLPEMRVDMFDNETVSDKISLEINEQNTKKYTYGENGQTDIMVDSSYCVDVLEVEKMESSDMQFNKYVVYSCEKKLMKKVNIDLITSTGSSETYKYTLYTSEGTQQHISENRIKIQEAVSECKGKNKVHCNKMHKCPLCAYEAKKIDKLKRHMLVHRDVSEIKMHKCSLCPHETKYKDNLKKHMLVHKGISKVKMYKCLWCAYEATENYKLERHMLVHSDVSEIKMHKCTLCAYEAKRKDNIEKHRLVHKDVSEIKMHKCSSCAYEAKHKSNLKQHTIVVHKNVSEIKMHKCSFCAYESKYKSSLKNHILVHKDVSEIKMHKCSICVYEAKCKRNLEKHVLVHKDVSEIKMLKCSKCAYETKFKNNLERHVLVHKDISEIKMHKCSLCAYESKHKDGLKKHILVHKNVAEINLMKCSLCDYVAKRKINLKKHKLVHKDVSEVKMHNCLLCAYKTKRKDNLKKHILVHKAASEVKMHKCSLCAYEAKRKSNLKQHTLVHKDVSEMKMHKCSLCAYDAKYKCTLKMHMLGHNEDSVTAVHKCCLCGYEAKQKSGLTRHMLVHENVKKSLDTPK